MSTTNGNIGHHSECKVRRAEDFAKLKWNGHLWGDYWQIWSNWL